MGRMFKDYDTLQISASLSLCYLLLGNKKDKKVNEDNND